MKWKQVREQLKSKAIEKDCKKIQNLMEHVEEVPESILDHIAKLYIQTCNVTYKIACYEYLVNI